MRAHFFSILVSLLTLVSLEGGTLAGFPEPSQAGEAVNFEAERLRDLTPDLGGNGDTFYDSLMKYFEDYLDSQVTANTGPDAWYSQSETLLAEEELFRDRDGGLSESSTSNNARLQTAIRLGDRALVEFCLTQYSFSEEELEHAFVQAWEAQSREIVFLLLKHNVNPNLVLAEDGYTLLHAAVDKRDYELAQALVTAGADIFSESDNVNALERAGQYCDSKMLYLLLGVNTPYAQLPMDERLMERLMETLGKCIRKDAAIVEVLQTGTVASNAKADRVKEDVRSSANAYFEGAREQTTLELEKMLKSSDIVGLRRHFQKTGPTWFPKHLWKRALDLAVDLHDMSLLRSLITEDHHIPGCVGKSKIDLVNVAITHNDRALLKQLIDKKANLNRISHGLSPIERAAKRQQIEQVEMLHNAGVDVLRGRTRGQLSFNLAMKTGNYALAERLKKAGVDVK